MVEKYGGPFRSEPEDKIEAAILNTRNAVHVMRENLETNRQKLQELQAQIDLLGPTYASARIALGTKNLDAKSRVTYSRAVQDFESLNSEYSELAELIKKGEFVLASQADELDEADVDSKDPTKH